MKNRLSWILKALITSGLLYYIFTIIPIEDIVPAIASARLEYFAVSFLLLLFKNYLAPWRMKRLPDGQGLNVSLRRIFEISLITNYYGLFLPGSLAGGAIRWHKLYQTDRNGLGVFTSIMFNRFMLTTATAATGVPNLEMMGFVDQFRSDVHSSVLENSWVMVNTATREALPNSFLEACAHRCAIMSSVDPDGFASLLGYHAAGGGFSRGLQFLLESGLWRERGNRGYEYVKQTFEIGRAIDQHFAFYERILSA